jgi:alanine-glyoxylate transaminase/serine-glyoxylate transaminase/serine-pyruvate transaminase
MYEPPAVGDLDVPEHVLLGPGPSMLSPRVRQAMSNTTLGYLDPAFVEVLNDIQELLRYVFQTDNEWTLAVSGTGTAAMEAAIGNLVEPGETFLVRESGYWGDRMAQMANRVGGEVVELEAPATEPLDPAVVERAFEREQIDVFGFCHADTTTGVRQPNVAEIADIAREHDAYTIMDCVTSLSGVPVHVDEWGVDVAYGSPQKCLSSTPGATPLTVNDRARAKIEARETETASWYLDLAGVMTYWADEQYHHTAPTTPFYGLRAALAQVAEEGLEARWERHREVAGELRAGLEDLGLEMAVDGEEWLPSLNTVQVPEGIDDVAVIDFLREEYGVEIAGGLGDWDGEVWRIGCMGYSARKQNVALLHQGMAAALEAQGYEP